VSWALEWIGWLERLLRAGEMAQGWRDGSAVKKTDCRVGDLVQW